MPNLFGERIPLIENIYIGYVYKNLFSYINLKYIYRLIYDIGIKTVTYSQLFRFNYWEIKKCQITESLTY